LENIIHVFCLDFSKAFDTVRHITLAEKLATLNLPDEIYNWLIAFISNRVHCTKFNNVVSRFASINASVVQGSAVGPVAFLVNASDLRPINKGNELLKYADDSYLIVPASLSSSCEIKLANISQWAVANNLKLNNKKETELLLSAVRFICKYV
jgi:Reverse transcriptase (RNA-dependent DNA polymerase)